jgi:hypothetical protein
MKTVLKILSGRCLAFFHETVFNWLDTTLNLKNSNNR